MSRIIEVNHVTFKYRGEEMEELTALDDISFDIQEGSFTAVLGQNGSGKSTIAKNINALLLPDAGDVYVLSMNTRSDDKLWDIRQAAGMVFQNPDNQLVSAIVEDDVAFGPENLGLPPEEIRQRVDEAMKSVGIYEERGKGPHLLSGGQKQRVAIAGVVAMRPKCIIMDEPTAMLDPKGRREVMAIIQKLNEEGITILLITHFMEEAAQADRVIVMEEGRILLDGTPKEIFSHGEQLKAAGIDVPAAVDMRNRLRKRGFAISDDVIDIESLVKTICQ